MARSYNGACHEHGAGLRRPGLEDMDMGASESRQGDLRDHVVVITGASSGIGRETSLEFGHRGARVVVAARNEAALQTLADEIRRQGGEALPVVTDVSDFA